MTYRIKIESTEDMIVYNRMLKKYINLIVGEKYMYFVGNPKNIKDRENNNREVEILGFTDNFMGDVIIRYSDNGRRGRLNPCLLIPLN